MRDRKGSFLCGWRGVLELPLENSRTMSAPFNREADAPYRTAWIDIDIRKVAKDAAVRN